MEDCKFMVLVRCITYNHSLFIESALDGFCIQETNFPFLCIIVDDASTDGEQIVLKKYLENHFDLNDKSVVRKEETKDYYLTFAQHKINRNCFFAVLLLKYNHYQIKKSKNLYFDRWRENAKYVAHCEGDDYWIVANKLQRQVDFMEKHSDYSLCCHRIYKYNQETGISTPDGFEELFQNNEYYTFNNNENNQRWFTQTQSLLYRLSAYDEEELSRFKYRRDVHLNYSLLSKGRGCLLPFLGAVYRQNINGIYAFTSDYDKGRKGYLVYKEMFKYYKDKILRDEALYYYNKSFLSAKKGENRIVVNDFFDLRMLVYTIIKLVYSKII